MTHPSPTRQDTPHPSSAPLGRPLRLGVLAFWTAIGLLESAKSYVSVRLGNSSLTALDVLIANMPWWYTWAALTPGIFWMARRFRLDRRPWVRDAIAHVGAALVVTAVHITVVSMLFYFTTSRGSSFVPSLQTQIRMFFDGYLAVDVMTYFAVVGGYYAIDFYRRLRERDVAAARLEAAMHEARLEALRMELNPHFLFNTLHAVSGLVQRGESAAAVTALARLGDLLRLTLDRRAQHEAPLEEELDVLREYLRIEELRFRDRLAYREEIDPAVLDAMVPTLILQPLVENALRHGIARQPGPGTVTLRAERIADELRLEVRDSGGGFSTNGNEGVGLSNTRGRLAHLYGDRGRLEITNVNGGAAAVVTLPFHTARHTVTA